MTDSIIVFDGVCVLCSRWVGFVLRRDRSGRFKFAAMQLPSCLVPAPDVADRFLH